MATSMTNDPGSRAKASDPFSEIPFASEEKNHVRRTWLHCRVMETLETDRGGGYRWDPTQYMPIPVEKDGEPGVAFARTRG